MPPHVPLQEARTIMRYQRVPIGEQTALLPWGSEMVLVDTKGNESRNVAQFSACRQYKGESVLTFDEPTLPTAADRAPLQRVTLPPGLWLEFALDQELDLERVAIGDPITAVLTRDAKLRKQVMVPKGALALGRIVGMHRNVQGGAYAVLALQFESVRFGNARASVKASLADVGTLPGITRGLPRSAWARGVPPVIPHLGPDIIVFGQSRHRLPRGFRMTWRVDDQPAPQGQ